ncbi:MAG: YgiQ family radical SAM protein [Eubacteriales bacterium]
MKHLPATKQEFLQTNWDRPDFVFVVGEAYVDHFSFGHAIISRVLQNAGYKVAMLPLPDYKDKNSFTIYGEPRLGFLVSSGNMDSMVNHYTAAKKKRSKDSYAPNDEAGLRPDRATIVYSNMIRQTYKTTPIILGGIEASLRRFAHYDYWSDSVRRSVLEDSGADILIYGMGEKAILSVADLLDKGVPVSSINGIQGICTISETYPTGAILLPSFDEVSADKKAFAQCFIQQQKNQDTITGKILTQKQHRKYIIQYPPQPPLCQEELDNVYEIPHTGTAHPMYGDKGISALNEVEFSLISARGCFGTCSFCSLAFHQGRRVSSRSHNSLVNEAKELTKNKNFKGYIHDVGGPTANFRHPSCEKQKADGVCTDKMCLYPTPCKALNVDHQDYLSLLRKLRGIDGVKKVFIRSGLRFDYIVADKNASVFIKEISKHHISGRLKVAPEHVSERVLNAMGKPTKESFVKFRNMYLNTNKSLGLNQHIEPYFISSHPGSTLEDAIELACYMKEMKIQPKQVQDFYPTPSTISTCMYYTGYDPRTMQRIYVPRGEEKKMQRALLQYTDPKNHALVIKALKKANREDLIGHGANCLVAPYKINKTNKPEKKEKPYSKTRKTGKRRK